MIVLQWDWKDGPNWVRLNNNLKEWKGPIIFNEVMTDSDNYAVVVANKTLSNKESSFVYRYWAENGVIPEENEIPHP